MTELATVVLPVAVAVAIAAGTWIVLRRTGIVAAESRETRAGRAALQAIEADAVVVLDPVIGQVDQLRRGQVEADTVAEALETASADTARLVGTARDAHVPRGLADVRLGMVAELERAGRALEMVEHGRTILASARTRGRELEAQTAVKRGYLNLLHAREALTRHAQAAADYRSPTEARRDARRAG